MHSEVRMGRVRFAKATRFCLSFALAASTTGFGAAPAAAAGGCYEPIPDPTAAGWTQEGFGTVFAGTPLEIVDPGTSATEFKNLYCADDALFSGEITLTPRVTVQSSSQDAEANTGIHVTIDDGTTRIRVALFSASAGTYEVRFAIDGAAGYEFSGNVADFVLKRLVGEPGLPDGTAQLTVPGTSFLALAAPSEFPTTSRPGLKTIEFGTYDAVAASSTTRWDRLGLPPLAPLAAAFDLDPKTINLKSKGQYLTAYIQSSAFNAADIDVSTVTLQAIDPVTSALLPVATGAPTSVGDGNGDGVQDRTVKFDRATVQSWFTADGDATFHVDGKLVDGRAFESDTLARIITAGVAHTDEGNAASIKY